MSSKQKTPNVVVCSTLSNFKSKDKGGALYELPPEKFVDSPQKDLSEYEKVSLTPVVPLKSQQFNYALDALTNAGIEIKFVDSRTFESLIGNPNQENLIAGLPAYRPSLTA